MLIGYTRASTHDDNLDLQRVALRELIDIARDIQFGKGQEVKLRGLAGLNRVYAVEWK